MNRKEKENLVLIGMPGCGKSTVGVVLAKALGYRFVDSDLVIQEREGRRLCEILEAEGPDGFNQIEEEVNASLTVTRTVIATGGSVIYGPAAMRHLCEIGEVIYLRLPLWEISERLGDLTGRGVSLRKGQTLRDLYEERVPLYEKYADFTVDASRCSIRTVVSRIIRQLPSGG